MSDTEADAINAGTVWWDGDLFSGRPGLVEAARVPAADAVGRGAGVPRRRDRRALPDRTRLGHLRPQRPAPARLAVHQGQGLPRDDHPEGLRRQRLLGVRALAGGDQALDPVQRRGGERDGAELARAGGAPAPLRHRGAKAPLPAAAREGPRDPLLRADQPACRVGRGGDPGPRRRLQGHVGRPRDPRHARDLGEALHHARAGGDAARARVPAARPRRPPRRRRRTSASPARSFRPRRRASTSAGGTFP